MAKKMVQAGVEFKADITGFQSEIKKADTSLKSFRNELKLNATQLKGDSENVDLLKQRQKLLTTELEISTSKVEAVSNKLKAQKEIFGEDSKEVEKTTQELIRAKIQQQEIQNELSKTNTELNKVTDSLEDSEKEIVDNRNAYEKLKDTISEQKNKLSDLQSNYASVVLTEGKNSQSAKELKKEIDNLNDELEKNEKQLSKVDVAANQVSDGGFTVFKGALADLASNAIQGCLSSLKELSEEVKETGMNFEYSLSKVRAISGASQEEMDQMKSKAKELGASTKFSASEVADGFQYMALAGWKTNEMVDTMPAILNLATAADMDLAKASDIVTDYLTAFGLETKDASSFVDKMAYAMANSNTNVEQLGEAYKNCASTAHSMGFNVDEVTASLATMANSGVKGGAAGTALNAIMTRLAAGTKESANMLKEYGIEVFNSQGQMNSLTNILNNISGVWGTLTQEQQANLAKTVAGQSAYSDFAIIMDGMASNSFAEYNKALSDCNGTAEDMARIMSDNLKGAEIEQQSLIEALHVSIFEDFESPMKDVTNFINQNFLKTLVDTNEKSGLVSAGITAIATTLGILAGALAISSLINGVTKAFALLNGTMLANPIVLIVALLAGLVVGFITLWNNCEEFRNFWIGLWDGITNTVLTGKDKVVGFLNGIGDFIKGNWQGLLLLIVNPFAGAFKLLYDNCEGFRNFWNGLWDGITNTVSVGKDKVVGFLNGIGDFIKGNWQGLLLLIVNPFAGAFKLLYDNCDAFRNKVDSLKNGVVNIFTGMVNAIKSIFSFQLELPRIKLPHFSLTPKGWSVGDLLKGSIPKLGIEWYEKGGIFKKPTIFNTSSGYKGVAEAGAEAVLPLSVLDEKLQNSLVTVLNNLKINQDAFDFDRLLSNNISNLSNMNIYNTQSINLNKVYDLLEIIAHKKLSFYVDSKELSNLTANSDDVVAGELIELRERGLEL